MCIWSSLHLLHETPIFVRRNEWDMIRNVYWTSCNYPLCLFGFNETWIFWTDFLKILRYKNLQKIRLLCAEVFQADRQAERETDRDRQTERDREGDRERERDRHRERDRKTDRERQTERQTERDRQTERQTDLTKLTVAFRNFANAPKTVTAKENNPFYTKWNHRGQSGYRSTGRVATDPLAEWLQSASVEGEWLTRSPSPLSAFVLWIKGWLCRRVGLDPLEKRKICSFCRKSREDSSVNQLVA